MSNKLKYEFIIHRLATNPDRYGNVSDYVVVTDVRNGRSIASTHVPESNARWIAYEVNGEHKQNFLYFETTITKKQWTYYTTNISYLSCDSKVLAAAFQKERRKRTATTFTA